MFTADHWRQFAWNLKTGDIFLTSPETGFYISCKLSPLETICTKYQILFSGKTKKIISICRLLQILSRVLSINSLSNKTKKKEKKKRKKKRQQQKDNKQSLFTADHWRQFAWNVKKLLIFFLLFPETGFYISCKLSPLETICTKYQILFSGKTKKIISICRLLQILSRVLSINSLSNKTKKKKKKKRKKKRQQQKTTNSLCLQRTIEDNLLEM